MSGMIFLEALSLVAKSPSQLCQALHQLSSGELEVLLEETTLMTDLPDNSGPLSYARPAALKLARYCKLELAHRMSSGRIAH